MLIKTNASLCTRYLLLTNSDSRIRKSSKGYGELAHRTLRTTSLRTIERTHKRTPTEGANRIYLAQHDDSRTARIFESFQVETSQQCEREPLLSMTSVLASK
jgi:hypothetical protein